MVPGGMGTEQGGVRAGSDSSGNSGLEGSDMVSSPTQDAEGLPPPSFPSGGSDAEKGTAEGHPTTSHLACLRMKFRDSCLSTEASNLMLASWRSKSS